MSPKRTVAEIRASLREAAKEEKSRLKDEKLIPEVVRQEAILSAVDPMDAIVNMPKKVSRPRRGRQVKGVATATLSQDNPRQGVNEYKRINVCIVSGCGNETSSPYRDSGANNKKRHFPLLCRSCQVYASNKLFSHGVKWYPGYHGYTIGQLCRTLGVTEAKPPTPRTGRTKAYSYGRGRHYDHPRGGNV